jgi:Flp pilus assembly protein CpaB
VRQHALIRSRWRRLARRRSTHWLAAGGLAIGTAWLAGTTLAGADAERRRWGEDRPVAVAAHRLEPGTTVARGDVIVRRWPRGLVPESALEAAPVGRTVVALVVPGEAVVSARLAPDGVHGLAALVPRGSRAVAVPVGPDALHLKTGDLVDLLATLEPAAAGGSGNEPTVVVAESAVVLEVGEQSVTVAVPAAAVSDVAYALASGTVTLALRGP